MSTTRDRPRNLAIASRVNIYASLKEIGNEGILWILYLLDGLDPRNIWSGFKVTLPMPA
ncbi:hypothetical protein PN499_07350 [Kamptonema animale CS-326]|uniref:hypothetical protein n=1 Tax=Kamptonema animale TaxID=92934 RepID=UPI00232DE344|nr:hypothetical protein [Kamptonema animale]MDB9510994.1 hypothetical protein [Kamptonema animale CS-326]